jgi:hypothetical protein
MPVLDQRCQRSGAAARASIASARGTAATPRQVSTRTPARFCSSPAEGVWPGRPAPADRGRNARRTRPSLRARYPANRWPHGHQRTSGPGSRRTAHRDGTRLSRPLPRSWPRRFKPLDATRLNIKARPLQPAEVVAQRSLGSVGVGVSAARWARRSWRPRPELRCHCLRGCFRPSWWRFGGCGAW